MPRFGVGISLNAPRSHAGTGGSGGGGGGGAFVARNLGGSQWVLDNSGGPADGYITSSDGRSFVIDTGAGSGLTVGVTDGQPSVTYP